MREHAGTIECEHRVQGARQGVHGQRSHLIAGQRAGAEQRIQVGAVIGMSVTDQHRVDLGRRREPEQPRQRRVAEVDDQAEAVVLDEVTAARLSSLWPGSAAAENREPHQADCSPTGLAIPNDDNTVLPFPSGHFGNGSYRVTIFDAPKTTNSWTFKLRA